MVGSPWHEDDPDWQSQMLSPKCPANLALSARKSQQPQAVCQHLGSTQCFRQGLCSPTPSFQAQHLQGAGGIFCDLNPHCVSWALPLSGVHSAWGTWLISLSLMRHMWILHQKTKQNEAPQNLGPEKGNLTAGPDPVQMHRPPQHLLRAWQTQTSPSSCYLHAKSHSVSLSKTCSQHRWSWRQLIHHSLPSQVLSPRMLCVHSFIIQALTDTCFSAFIHVNYQPIWCKRLVFAFKTCLKIRISEHKSNTKLFHNTSCFSFS